MNKIRKAFPGETGDVLSFYDGLLRDMQGNPYNPIWKRGVYPDEPFIRKSIENGELFVMINEGKIVSAMVLNNSFGGDYEDAEWKAAASPDETMVIHMLAVSIPQNGKGYGGEMVRYAVNKAKNDGIRSVRLDVYPKNVPAIRAYETAGFKYVETRSTCYGDSGTTEFMLYELPMENQEK